MLKARGKLISLLTACMALVLMLVMGIATLSIQPKVASAADTNIVFALGANGSASHADGSSVSTYNETQGNYKLSITGGSSMYTGARDAKGNSCIKLGTSSKTGSFSFTVPSDVTSVIVAVGKYKSNTSKVTINGTTTTLTKNSNDGAYDEITVNTSSTKTVSVTTASGGIRAMVNTITFVIPSNEPVCEHEYEWNQKDGKHIEVCSLCEETKEGATWETCDGELTYTTLQSGENGTHKKVGSCSTCGADLSTNEETCDFEETVEGTTKTYACECGNNYTEELALYTVTLSSYDGESENLVADGSKITLPTVVAPEGYVFVGWSETSITGTTETAPSTFTGAYTVTSDKTLYAVYKNDAQPSGWSLVASKDTLATGDTVTIVATTKNVAIGAVNGTYYTSVNISISNNTFDENANVLKLKLTINSDGSYSFYTGSTYLGYTGSSNTLNSISSIDETSSWDVTINAGATKILNKKASTRNLQYNASSPRFACYTSSQTAVSLFEYSEGEPVSYRTTFCDHSGEMIETTKNPTCTTKGSVTVACGNCGQVLKVSDIPATDHANRTTTTVDATCTEDGLETVTCDDCGETLSTTSIPATGHSLDEGVITKQPDVGVEGEKTYTCQNEGCDYTEIESVPALDAETFVVSYSVPKGIKAVDDSDAVVSGETIVLPTANTKEGFVFVGWVLTETVGTEVCPEVFLAETEYTVTENITLYALYSYNTGSGDYVKVTESLSDWSGKYLIVYESGEKAYIFNGVDAVNGYVSATTNGTTIVNSEEISAEAVILAKMEGGYSILTKNGYIYGTSNNNKLNFNATTAQLNTIAIKDNGTVNIINNDTYLRFNAASNQMRFRYYKTDSQEGICLYKLDGSICYSTSLPSMDGASVTLGEDVALNYYVTMADSLENVMMNFTMNGEVYDRTLTQQSDGRYKVSLELPPQYMANEILIELIYNDTVVETMSYSVKAYAQSMLNNSESSNELKRLVSDMLYYGAAAQTYRNYNVENLATKDVENLLSATEILPETTDFSLENNESIDTYPAYFKSAGVHFADVNKIYVKLIVEDIEKVTLKVNGVEVEVNDTTVYTDGILATQFAETYTFVLYHDGVEMQTLTYSVNAYTYAKQGESAMGRLAVALYRYGVSAKTYYGGLNK